MDFNEWGNVRVRPELTATKTNLTKAESAPLGTSIKVWFVYKKLHY